MAFGYVLRNCRRYFCAIGPRNPCRSVMPIFSVWTMWPPYSDWTTKTYDLKYSPMRWPFMRTSGLTRNAVTPTACMCSIVSFAGS